MKYIDRIKLPEDQRPSIDQLFFQLKEKVSRQLSNLFIEDYQNDCSCLTEPYDLDSGVFSFISSTGISIGRNFTSTNFFLPMLGDISNQDIINLLRVALSLAGNQELPKYEGGNSLYGKMLYNPKIYKYEPVKLYDLFTNFTDRYIKIFRDGTIYNWIPLDIVPENCVYFLPDPEYFGCITVNIGKYGAFCCSKHIIKKELI